MTDHDPIADEVHALADLLGQRSKPRAGIYTVKSDRRTIAEDSIELLGHAVRDLGGDVPPTVRVLLAAFARRTAVAGFFESMSDQHGLGTDDGVRFAGLANTHQAAAQRALRAALDTYARLTSASKPGDGLARLRERIRGAAK